MNRLLTILLITFTSVLIAQEPMRVTRSAGIDRSAPIYNIYVDAENNKWVGNSLGVFKVHTVDFSTKVEMAEDQDALLRYSGGNANILWKRDVLFDQMKKKTDDLFEGEEDIIGAFYDERKKELWIGTKGIGVFRFDMSGDGKLKQQISMDNSKLRTDMITVMYSDKPGSYWIGSEEGVLHNAGGKWKLYEKYVNIEAIAGSLAGVWVFGDGYLWKVGAGNNWEEIELAENLSEGPIKDIAFDSQGRMWVASEIVVRYNPDLGTVEEFGAAEYFTSDFATVIVVDQDDAVWVGTEDKGLYLIEKATAMTISCILDKAPDCDGQGDAELKVVVSGGDEPYTYQWNSNLEGANPKNVKPGDYEVTVTDSKGKSKTSGITINDPSISVEIVQNQAESAAGANDGIATVNASGGQGDYTFRWDNGETSAKAQKLNEGQHSVTVTDKSGCSGVASINISQSAAPLLIALKQTEEIQCVGTSTGAIVAEVQGGRAPFKYAWNQTNLSGAKPDNLVAGEYIVTITDSEGTSSSATISIADPKGVSAAIEVESPASTGNSDGKATVKAQGGTGSYTYSWDNGETSMTASKLAPGTRAVTVTDGNGCSTTAEVEISENILPLSASLESSGEISCPGDNTGALTVRVKGGKGPFSYAWSGSDLSGEQVEGLVAGKYEVTITDVEGTTAKANAEVEEPEAMSASIEVESPASTGNSDGQASVKAQGGTGSYSYSWDNGETSMTASKLAPGTRAVTVTDGNGCSTTAEVEISENILPLTASLESSGEIRCPGDNTGALTVRVKGGKGPFSYAWSGSDLSGEQVKGLIAGKYEVTITDVEGTTAKANAEVEEPEAISASIEVESPASTDNSDGKATVKAQGGTGSYSYSWDNGEATQTASKLAPGTRVVTVTDGNGCSTTAEVEISENILPLTASLESSGEIRCPGDNTGALTVRVKGGKGPFSYAWSGADLSGDQVQGLIAGQYEVTITDVEGTTAKANAEVEEPEAIGASIEVESPASTDNSDGKATVKAQGGTGSYSYSWDNGEATQTASKLAPGTRVVTVTDGNGCSTTAEVEISENILPLTASLESNGEIRCQGESTGALGVKVKGGKGPFSFAWSETTLSGEEAEGLVAGKYEVTITDVEGTTAVAKVEVTEPQILSANVEVESPASTDNSDGKATVKAQGGTGSYIYSWDNGEATQTASKLAPGTRVVTVTDGNGCSTTAEVEISENILPLSASLESNGEIRCQGESTGALTVRVKGGKRPFSYAWNETALSGEQAEGLVAGKYEVTITDKTGTTAMAKVEIEEPKTLTATVNVSAPASTDNSDGKASVKAQGGTGSYTYAWDNGETSVSASKLAPGTRTVTVTDSNGCSTTAEVEISENILPLTVDVESSGEIKCQGESTITLSVKVNGGKGPFEYTWEQSNLSGANVSNVGAGNYKISVTDALGTSVETSISVEEPKALVAELSENKQATNENSKDGLARVAVQGGTAPYTIAWDNGETGEVVKNLMVGNHKALITDANGCNTELTFETKKRILPQLTLSRLRKGQKIKMEQLFFEADSFRITEVSRPVLDELFGFMIENTSVVIEVGGHTNDVPEDAFCDYLSTARAKSVADYIVQKGIDPKRVFFKGYGKRKPLVSNRTAAGRAKNQRVEIKILSI